MWSTISLLFVGIVSLSCTKDGLPEEETGKREDVPPIEINKPEAPTNMDSIPTWIANPIAWIDNGSVTLEFPKEEYDNSWGMPIPLVLNPDTLDIYMSKNDALNFEKAASLKFGEASSYTVEDLENGSPHFFYISSIRGGVERGHSEVIMTVPNRKKPRRTMFEVEKPKHTMLQLALSPDKKKVAYSDNYEVLMITDPDGRSAEMAGSYNYNPSWSPSSNKIVFIKEIRMPLERLSQLALYDCKTKAIKQLTFGIDFHFRPNFIDDNRIFYAKSINGAETVTESYWIMNLSTLESSEVVFTPPISYIGNLSRIDNDRFYFSGVETDKQYQIYEASISGGKAIPVFSSQWNDTDPSLSPDRNKLAFVSRRAGGHNRIWIYDFATQKYAQITGYKDEESIAYWNAETRIDWVDNSTLQFVTNDNRLVRQGI